MKDFGVSLKKQAELDKIFKRYEIKESDIEEKFVRSSGKGGQNVNKVSSAVYLKHFPTDTEVKYHRERTQGLNRFLARRLLAKKIEENLLGELSKKRQMIKKIRNQKKKRSKKAKEKILRNKKITSYKKEMREKVSY
ncbi:MAG: peptide chain release factor-like protein [Endomicrobium sp.]|jgi:protein subunit release factor B|nr:peptide chain release factor-like protein [Endomicrobium sp.]MDR2644717.1 peptide chain release factor-like protein [Endomicrobium sp.]